MTPLGKHLEMGFPCELRKQLTPRSKWIHSFVHVPKWDVQVLRIQISPVIVSRPPKARWTAQQADTPDFAPGDFVLFGYLKQQLQEANVPDRKNLKSAISSIFREIGGEVLISVFPDWIKRLEWIIENGGEHYNM
jgi:hypothetical protein